MDKDLDLNTSGNLPDGTAASQSGGFGAKASDVRQGFTKLTDSEERTENLFSEDDCAPEAVDGTKTVSPREVGGFCGRPAGWQR